ncbi:fetal and adult testis-expressed transcript protein [Manis javanica]|uniref:fetal and adult testis-expressed transcript protein n=1 Tax=Manis javanica TaxID=9974 RepID=UPI001879FAA9|nr:fetal and adult testis-expressed transcript protein [Manis javanica]
MSANPAVIKEEMEISMAEEPAPGSCMPTQLGAGMTEHGSWPPSAPQRRQKLEAKVAGFAAGQPVWNIRAVRPRKVSPVPRMPREKGFGDAHSQHYPGSFQCMRSRRERNMEVDRFVEINMEGPNAVEMEVMRKELCTVTQRVKALEEQSTAWHHREVLLFTMLVSACIANLWLWLSQ